MIVIGFSAKPEKLGRFRGHFEGELGAFSTAGEAAGGAAYKTVHWR